MSDQTEPDFRRIAATFFPTSLEAEERVAKSATRFVHYTSAQAALEILKSRCMWMRNATCMNDYNEMRHGLNCLLEVFRSETGKAFLDALETCHTGLAAELDAKFSSVAPALLEHSYVTCVSEHQDDEELYGRLSMWRSYGSGTGVALVFNNGPFIRPSDALKAYSTPVAYTDAAGMKSELQKMAEQIAADRSYLGSLPREDILELAFRALVFAVVSTKHEGFREEKEWRVVHFPTIWNASPDRLPLDQVVLGGIPQPVFKIPFVDYPDEGLYGVTVPDLVNRVIVGPTQYPVAIRTAFAQVLSGAGVQNAIDRVHCSNVTLRV